MMDIAGAIKAVFSFGAAREENRGTRYYQKTIKRLRRALDGAEDYIENDKLLILEKDPDEIKALKKAKAAGDRQFKRFN